MEATELQKFKIKKMMDHVGRALDLASELEEESTFPNTTDQGSPEGVIFGVVKHLHRAFFWVTMMAEMHGVPHERESQQTRKK